MTLSSTVKFLFINHVNVFINTKQYYQWDKFIKKVLLWITQQYNHIETFYFSYYIVNGSQNTRQQTLNFMYSFG